MNIEVWLPIKGFPGYEVSNRGRVRSFRKPDRWNPCAMRKFPTICKLHRDKKWGYWHFGPRKEDGKRVNLLIHQVVAEAFMGPCPEGMEVNHVDGNKANNWSDNLEYSTPSQNRRHAIALGLVKPARGTQCGKSKLTEKDVRDIREARNKYGARLTVIAEEYSVSFQTISAIAKGKSWSWL